jgi:hypothetical protein
MYPLAVVKQWSMAQLMHPRHSRFISAFKLLCQHCWVCTSDVTNAFVKSDHPEIQSRSIICAVIASSDIGGQNSTLTFPFPPIRLFLSSKISRVILKASASGQFVAIRALSRSTSRTLCMLCVCTTALVMTTLSSYFEWLTIFPLRVDLRKLILAIFEFFCTFLLLFFFFH